MPKEIRYPFAIGPDGAVASVGDPDRQVRQRVHALLGTEPNERVMVTDYGVESRSMVFEPGDEHVAERLASSVREQMDTYEPGVLVRSVEPVPSTRGSGLASIAIDYVRRESPNTPFALSRQSNTAVIGVGGTVSEVIRG